MVLVDDSIVRGTTCARTIVSLLREAGATEVHMRISAPPFVASLLLRHRCATASDKLIACRLTTTWRRSPRSIGVDSLGFLERG